MFEQYNNEHDEDMTRKYSYNYKVLKRLYPDVYKLPESEIRSLVGSIYDNPKTGDELLNHLTNVINKKKPEWDEYLNPKPDTGAMQRTTQSGFGLNQMKVPDLTGGMNFKRSDMVKGFGINENKANPMTGFGLKPSQSFAGTGFKVATNDPAQIPSYSAFNQNNKDYTADNFTEHKRFLMEKEIPTYFPYLDKDGHYTTCVGHMDERLEDFEKHPWRVAGQENLPTQAEIRERLNRMDKNDLNYLASYYKPITGLELPEEYCMQLLDKDVAIRDKELARGFPNYNKLSQNIKNALMDAHYTSNILNWPKLKKAISDLDKENICKEISRKTKNRPDMVSRNEWAKKQCERGFILK